MKLGPVVCMAALLCGSAWAQQRVQLDSVTPVNTAQVVRRALPTETTRIDAYLYRPEASAKMPAMVVAHGSGGVGEQREHAWARWLVKLGIAALVVDSYGPRGIRETATDQSRLATDANLADAFAGLMFLAAEPSIDPSRIGIIGFSKGGQVALWTALEPLRQAFVPGGLRFALHIPFYAPCGTRYVAAQVDGSPIWMFHGELDDYTPIGPCRDYAEWFRGKGVPVAFHGYPTGRHGFDTPARLRMLQNAQTARDCRSEYQIDVPRWIRLDTGQVLDGRAIGAYFRECVVRGAHFGGDEEAAQQARIDLYELLKKAGWTTER